MNLIYDANTALTDSISEKYEGLYVKIFDLIKQLITKGASAQSLTLTVPPHIAERFTHNTIDKQGKHHVSWCQKYKVFQDTEMPNNQVKISSDIEEWNLIIENWDL